MRKESGEITTDIPEMLKICTDFYKSLYNQTVPIPESTMKSCPGTEEIPVFTEEEVERTIKRMKTHKAHEMDGITSDIITLGGQTVLAYRTNIFDNILKTKQIPDSCHEAKMVILYKKETPQTSRTTDLPAPCHTATSYKFVLKELWIIVNQPREQARF